MRTQLPEAPAGPVDLEAWEADVHRRRRAWAAVCVAAASSFLFVVDSGFLALTLPKIEAEFPHVHRSVIEWVATSFMVMQASLLLIAGRMGDKGGRKKFFLIGLVAFSCGSLFTALAPNLPAIIAARAFTGAAAAFLTAGTLAIVLPMFPSAKAGEAVGIWGAVASVAGWLTPLIGPWLVHDNWRWAFAVLAPIGFGVALVGLRLLPEQFGDQEPGPTDKVSLIVGPPALGLLMLVLSNGRVWGWTSATTVLIGALVAALLATLVHRSRHFPQPLLDLELLRYRGYTANITGGVLQQAGFFAFWITGPLIMTSIWHWSIMEVGLAMATTQLFSSVGSPLAGRLVSRFGYRDLAIAGGLFVAVAMAWLALTSSGTPNLWGGFVPAALLFGLGCSMCGTLTSGGALAALPAGRLGAGNSLQQLVRRMGGAIGVALAYVFLGDAKGTELLAGGRRVWWMVAAVHLILIVPLLAGGPSRPRGDEGQPPAAR